MNLFNLWYLTIAHCFGNKMSMEGFNIFNFVSHLHINLYIKTISGRLNLRRSRIFYFCQSKFGSIPRLFSPVIYVYSILRNLDRIFDRKLAKHFDGPLISGSIDYLDLPQISLIHRLAFAINIILECATVKNSVSSSSFDLM